MEYAIKRKELNGSFDSVEELMGALDDLIRFILQEIIVLLCNQTTRPEIFRDYASTNSRNDKDMRACHIELDWLLV